MSKPYSLVLVCKIHVRVDMKQILIGYLSLSICSIWEMLAWMTLELSKSFCGKSSEFPLLLVVIIVYKSLVSILGVIPRFVSFN